MRGNPRVATGDCYRVGQSDWIFLGTRMIHLEGLPALLVILAVTVLPLSLAARFVGSRYAGPIHSTLAVLLGGLAGWISVKELGVTIPGVLIAFLATCAVFGLVFRVALPRAIVLAFMALSLQVIIGLAVASFLYHFYGIDSSAGLHLPVAHQ
jgi:hypothetical protein